LKQCAVRTEWQRLLLGTHTFNALTRLRTQAESLNSLWIRTCNSDSKIFFLKQWFGPSLTAHLLWTASSYVICPFAVWI